MKDQQHHASRRSFLRRVLLSIVMLPFAGLARLAARSTAAPSVRPGPIRRAAVIWYSQAGHTERNGRLMARTLEKRGLMVFAADYREFDRSRLASVDLIIVGSPVYYYDVPCNFRQWLSTMPDIEGVPVAAFVTYGGEGGNQHNAACALMDLMVARKGAPVALETFGNMSTYPPTWTMGYEERILNYSFLPDEATFSRVRTFAIQAQEAASRGRTIAYDTHFDFRDAIKGSFALWAGFKLFSGGYSIDEKKCINCGTCVEKCPVGAVDLPAKSISSDACIACMGCVNNCPVDAINITFMGKRLYGFFEFLKRKKISIKEPAL